MEWAAPQLPPRRSSDAGSEPAPTTRPGVCVRGGTSSNCWEDQCPWPVGTGPAAGTEGLHWVSELGRRDAEHGKRTGMRGDWKVSTWLRR